MKVPAEERARIAIESFPVLGEHLTVTTAIKAAFRDGAKAERERIMKRLREPSDELVLKAHTTQCRDETCPSSCYPTCGPFDAGDPT